MKTVISLSLCLISFSSFGEVKGIDQIIGDDTRIRVTNINAKDVHSSIGLLLMRYSSGMSMCTGTVVGRRHVITAAHCLYRLDKKETAQVVKFYPGLREEYKKGNFPFGEFVAKSIRVNEGYKVAGAVAEDYALLTFEENLPVDPRPMGVLIDQVTSLTIAGYPSDKAMGEMWEGSGFRLFNNHYVDTISGQSGSAIRYFNKVVGIHHGALTSIVGKTNLGFFFSFKTLKKVKDWIKAD